MSDQEPDPLSQLQGDQIVVDLRGPFVILGRLVGSQGRYVLLEDVDVHDLRDTATNREQYVLNSRAHGIRANRRRAWVSSDEIVDISRLDDVILD